MSMHTKVTRNSVKIAEHKIAEVRHALRQMDHSGVFEYFDPIAEDGKLSFDDPAGAIDWLCENEELATVIAATGAKGDVTFACPDDVMYYWGMRFNGDYTFNKLRGTVVYSVV